MQHTPQKRKDRFTERARAITAYSLVANLLILTIIAASGALAPYAALNAVFGPEIASFVLPPIPRFAGPLVSRLAADAAASHRSRRPAPLVATSAEAGTADGSPRDASPPAVAPAPSADGVTETPVTTGLTPTASEPPTVTPVTPPSTGGPTTPEPPTPVVRPAKSHGKALGVLKKATGGSKKHAGTAKAVPGKAKPKKVALSKKPAAAAEAHGKR